MTGDRDRFCDVPRQKEPRTAWIAEVRVSPATAAKIRDKHGLDPAEVAALAESPPPRIGRIVRDDRGTRLYLTVRTSAGQQVLVVLHPAGEDIWHLASAYVQKRQRRA